jgi:hypothetical protein
MQQHWDNATKHVTDLPPDVAAEMLYHKYTRCRAKQANPHCLHGSPTLHDAATPTG